jgi:Protein of unknown function (DUF4058)
MPSPFPGMDPYIEAQGLWESCHAALVTHSAEALNQRLPEGYVAKIEAAVRMVTQDIPPSRRIPDVLIGREADDGARPTSSSQLEAGVATIEPITIPFALGEEEVRDRWIEILGLPAMELVTVVEILATGNKAGGGRRDYLEKRSGLIDGSVNFVEIDLLLAGRRMPMAKPLPPGDYYAVVGRSTGSPDTQVYAWTIRHSLPAIPIPLRAPDPDVLLDLRQAFDLTYDRGRYSRLLHYGNPLPEGLALSRADREWSESIGR